MAHWRFTYKEHAIEVRNGWFAGEELLVDGELQDKGMGFGFRGRLYGRVKSGQGEGEPIRVSLGGWWTIGCVVFVDDREVFRSWGTGRTSGG